jgi:hypothetical protein
MFIITSPSATFRYYTSIGQFTAMPLMMTIVTLFHWLLLLYVDIPSVIVYYIPYRLRLPLHLHRLMFTAINRIGYAFTVINSIGRLLLHLLVTFYQLHFHVVIAHIPSATFTAINSIGCLLLLYHGYYVYSLHPRYVYRYIPSATLTGLLISMATFYLPLIPSATFTAFTFHRLSRVYR